MRFLKSLSYTFCSSIIYALVQWIIIAMIGRIVGINGVGIYSLALGLALPINMFFNFGVRQIICSESRCFSQNSYLYTILIFQGIGLVLALSISFIFYTEYTNLIFFVYLVKVIESVCEVTNGLSQRNEQFKLIAISRIARSILSVIAVAITLVITHNLVLAIFSQLIVSLISVFLFDIKQDKSIVTDPKLYQVGLPLAVAGFLVSQKIMIPRMLLEHYSDMTSLGVFASITYIVSAGGLVVTSISQVIIPKINKNNKSSVRVSIIKRGSSLIFIFSFLSSIVLYFFSDEIFSLLFKSKVNLNKIDVVFLVLLLITSFMSSFFGYMASALKQLKMQPIIYVFLIILMFVIFYMIKSFFPILYAIYGAVIITNIIQLLCLLYLIKVGVNNENSTYN